MRKKTPTLQERKVEAEQNWESIKLYVREGHVEHRVIAEAMGRLNRIDQEILDKSYPD